MKTCRFLSNEFHLWYAWFKSHFSNSINVTCTAAIWNHKVKGQGFYNWIHLTFYGPVITRHYNTTVLSTVLTKGTPDSKVHGANMGPIWDRQDPAVPHVGPMNLVLWDLIARLGGFDTRHLYNHTFETCCDWILVGIQHKTAIYFQISYCGFDTVLGLDIFDIAYLLRNSNYDNCKCIPNHILLGIMLHFQ